MSNIIAWSFKKGLMAQKKPPEKQKEIAKNVEDKLTVVQHQETTKHNLNGSFLIKKRDEAEEKQESINDGLSPAVHKTRFIRGCLFIFFVLLLILGEFFLLLWTLSPFGLKTESVLIAAAISTIGMLSADIYLAKIKKIRPESYNKYLLYFVLISLVLLITAGILLAYTRGVLMQNQVSVGDLENQIKVADNFYKKTSYLPVVMGMISIALSLIMGVVLHQALPKVINSGNVLMLDKRLEKIDSRILYTKQKLEKSETIVRDGMAEFYNGLDEDIPERKQKKGFSFSPLYILILAALLLLLLAVSARGEERQSVYLLIDLSKSTLCKDYEGKSNFQMNMSAVPEIIKNLSPGTELKIIGITDRSFERPYLITKAKFPNEKGAFGEKLAKTKLSIIEKWKKLNLRADSDETDIISCLHLASVLFNSNNGNKKVIILSDMRQSIQFDLESPDVINEEILDEIGKEKYIPRLDGVKVWVLGASPCGKSLAYFKSLRKFWEGFFRRAGAFLVKFSIERDWSGSGA
ncbi:MAG: hypothetical protein JW755_05585 [Candidatus Aminicenantes bacterium]|nr:hypothetical protein [Candidatus Aminicenantes bacterium]